MQDTHYFEKNVFQYGKSRGFWIYLHILCILFKKYDNLQKCVYILYTHWNIPTLKRKNLKYIKCNIPTIKKNGIPLRST